MLKHGIGKSLNSSRVRHGTSVAKRNGNSNTWGERSARKERGHLHGLCLRVEMTGVLDFTSRE